MPDPQTHDQEGLIEPSSAHRYEVTADDLPLSCPMPGMYLWSSHPKVYIPLHKTGEGKCPYCGAEYVVKDFDPDDPRIRAQHRRE
ncbi:zinc-finger domain-containing protein [Arhodomonas sp. AD133]|uniref:zinc-finger domain-containing protein n=1 Tax=Arhodomonas sp. AD133 TaxID=3415009 RepID=UPI003EBFA581